MADDAVVIPLWLLLTWKFTPTPNLHTNSGRLEGCSICIYYHCAGVGGENVTSMASASS
jgi:hypothetical protein